MSQKALLQIYSAQKYDIIFNMPKPQRAVDGFFMDGKLPHPQTPQRGRTRQLPRPVARRVVAQQPSPLNGINLHELPGGATSSRRPVVTKKKSKRKIIARVSVLVALLLLVGAGYFGYRVLYNTSKVFKGNPLAAVFAPSDTPLKQDAYGRTNILVVGTTENDPNHPGAQLTDSMMIISLDQKKHDAFIVSVPRDLWVKIPNCAMFSAEKINAIYECASNMGKDEDAGQTALRDNVGAVFGVALQYSIHVNLAVVKSGVDAVGGVDITVASSDPRGILDRNFDWRCKFTCYMVKYPNGPTHLTGDQAMYLAQARGDAPWLGTYGLSRGNFDREANQRKILTALKDKATTIGFLANPSAVLQLLDSLGDNVRTNIDSGEIKTFIKVAKDTDSKNVNSISLIDQKPAVFTTGTGPNGSSIVETVAGLYDYTPIQRFMKLQLSGQGQLMQENATVSVLNASGKAGAAQTLANKLTANNINNIMIGNAPDSAAAGQTTLYDLTGGKKPATLAQLKSALGIQDVGTALPQGVTASGDFVVIIGATPAGTPSN